MEETSQRASGVKSGAQKIEKKCLTLYSSRVFISATSFQVRSDLAILRL